MADEIEPEVKDIERVEVAPAEGGETVEAGATAPESSPATNEGEGSEDDESEGESKPDQLVTRKPAENVDQKPTGDVLKKLPAETPREYALRLEVNRLRTNSRKERSAELIGTPENPVAPKPPTVSPQAQNVLAKYKPEEIQSLKEVLPVIAEELGFVKKDQLGATTYADKANEILESFLETHTEYLPENDADNLLWNRFTEEYKMYKQPANPKDYKKIFDRIHKDIFGIQPAGPLPTQVAGQRKANVASHAGASGPTGGAPRARSKPAAEQGLRLDMLKGFSAEEIAELEGE